jgi:uncharacterized surface protein with fasciclin (FAS1) repeats
LHSIFEKQTNSSCFFISSFKQRKMKILFVIFALFFFFSVSHSANTIAQIVANDTNLSSLNSLLVSSSLNNTLGGGRMFTLFAPTNAAFTIFQQEFFSLYTLIQNNATVAAGVLAYMVSPQNLSMTQFYNFDVLPTLSGTSLLAVQYGSGNSKITTINGAVITNSAVASNGVVYYVNEVILTPFNLSSPSVVAGFPQLSTLFGYFQTLFGGALSVNNFTFLAPTNQAWANYNNSIGGGLGNLTISQLTGIILNHVIPSGIYYAAGFTTGTYVTGSSSTINVFSNSSGVWVNGNMLGPVDLSVAGTNPNTNPVTGVVQVINAVLVPGQTTTAMMTTGVAQMTTGSMTGSPSTSGASFLVANMLMIVLSLFLFKMM